MEDGWRRSDDPILRRDAVIHLISSATLGLNSDIRKLSNTERIWLANSYSMVCWSATGKKVVNHQKGKSFGCQQNVIPVNLWNQGLEAKNSHANLQEQNGNLCRWNKRMAQINSDTTKKIWSVKRDGWIKANQLPYNPVTGLPGFATTLRKYAMLSWSGNEKYLNGLILLSRLSKYSQNHSAASLEQKSSHSMLHYAASTRVAYKQRK